MAWVRSEITFDSGGLRCAAWLYRPEGESRPPVVVMAHGFGGTRALLLDRYAERFASLGLACLVFDYRHLGDSEGQPRQIVDVEKQLEDWRAAVTHVRERTDVDGERVGLWGTSFSGGHVLVTAATLPDIRAIVAQVPFVDARTRVPGMTGRFMLRMLLAALRDRWRARRGKEPYLLPIVAPPGELAVLNAPGAWDGYRAIVAEDVPWRNEVAARVLFSMMSYRPVLHAGRVGCPLLLVPARHDELIPLAGIEEVARRAPRAALEVVDARHFEVYTGDHFERLAQLEGEFLARHLT